MERMPPQPQEATRIRKKGKFSKCDEERPYEWRKYRIETSGRLVLYIEVGIDEEDLSHRKSAGFWNPAPTPDDFMDWYEKERLIERLEPQHRFHDWKAVQVKKRKIPFDELIEGAEEHLKHQFLVICVQLPEDEMPESEDEMPVDQR